MRSRTVNIFALLLLSLTSIVMAQNQPLTFEVATVKPSQPSTGFSFALCHGIDTRLPVYPAGSPITVPALGRCLIKSWTLTGVISFAYPLTAAAVLPADRVSGGPPWAASDGFDIEAKAENAASATDAELHSMLQQLLADRFKLQFHTAPKEFNGYALTVGKNGHKLVPGADEPSTLMGSFGRVSMKNSPMVRLAQFLSTTLKAPVMDRTGLKGVYTFSFSQPAPNDPSAASIFTVLQEELGLRLESTKVSVDVIIIDHAEKPDAN
jgi:uncharacterized protein (TIGR03435 family)